MTLSSLPSASGRKPKPDAKTLNARLAHTIPHTSSPPYAHYSTPLHSSVGSYNSATPPSSPPREFTTPVSPPIPGEGCARLEPHLPTLQALDKVYSQSEHPVLDGYRMIGAGGVGNPWPEEKRQLRDEERGVQGRSGGGGGVGGLDGGDGRMEEDVDAGIEVRTRKAMKVLEDHIRDRTPFVQASSRRMQAVMGVRNELAFDLPDIKRPTAYVPLPSPPSSLDAGHSARTTARNPSTFHFVNPLSPLNSPSVDSQTGKGLREWFLSKGKGFGMRKIECRSISFHDFTPDMRNNTWSNKLLGHFAADGARERVDFYEVDLPTITTDPSTGTQTPTTQTWLWFLISRPLLAINAKNTSTRPPSHNKISHPSSVSNSPQTFHTPGTRPPNLPTPWPTSSPVHPQPNSNSPLPPNFQIPIPTSWLVFACPLENVTAYPEALDIQSSTGTSSFSSRTKFPSSSRKGGKKIYKRRDFDFSHNGLPIFEFNNTTGGMFNGDDGSELPPFLEVGEIGPFYSGDEHDEIYSDADFEAKIGQSGGENKKYWLGMEQGGKKVESPYKGQWWEVFYQQIAADATRWEDIRAAMSRGKCRVVIRYTEFTEDMDFESDSLAMAIGCEVKGLFGLGIGGLDAGTAGGGGEGKKIKERIAGRQRLTRSETRRRSGLGLSEVSSSGVVVGIGGPGAVGAGKGKGKSGGRK